MTNLIQHKIHYMKTDLITNIMSESTTRKQVRELRVSDLFLTMSEIGPKG